MGGLLRLFWKIWGCLSYRCTTGIITWAFPPDKCQNFISLRLVAEMGKCLHICCSFQIEGANFSNSEGYTSLRIIASPSLNQDQLWRLFDLVPGLDFLHLDSKSRLVCIALTAWHMFTLCSNESYLRLHTPEVLNTTELCGSWSWFGRACLLRSGLWC
jgi:hypothetical protein